MISKKFSFKRSASRITFLIPVLALCVYFFNNEIVAKPALKNNNSTESAFLMQNIQDPDIISIRLEGEKIFVNNQETDLNKFAEHLNDLTNSKSNSEIKKMNFRMQTRNAEDGILDLLNKEFEKSRFSKVTGHSVLPPPPPVPADHVNPPPAPPSPENAGQVPPPPPPAAVNKNAPSPPPTPALNRKQDSLRRVHMNERERAREQMRMERDVIKAERREEMAEHRKQLVEERKEIIEKRKQLLNDDKLTEEERKKFRKELAKEREEVIEEMNNIREKYRNMEKRERMNIPPPPPPPSPEEVIDEVASAGGTIYYNGEKISARKAKEIASNKKNLQIKVNNTGDASAKIEISDN